MGAVKAAIQACCLQLKAKIARAQAAKEQKLRKRNLTRYIPDVANALFGMLRSMADGGEDAARESAATQLTPTCHWLDGAAGACTGAPWDLQPLVTCRLTHA